MESKSPLALFDSIEYIGAQKSPAYLSKKQKEEFSICVRFLNSYTGSLGTFNSYRREIERLLHWIWVIRNKTLKTLKRENIENFLKFCQHPKKAWIGTKKVPRFLEKEGLRVPNPQWRPFLATVSKSSYRKGNKPDKNNFDISHGSVKEIFAILSTFYNYLLQEEYVYANPVALIRQKSKFIRKNQTQPKIRRLSEIQWRYVLTSTEELAEKHPEIHERTLFMMSALYSLYLRISELSANTRWIPLMNHFQRDSDGNWWFITVGKGNKQRQIAVSNNMLNALKRWRKYLGVSLLPTPADSSPLFPKSKGKGPVSNTSHIRKIVQLCFDKAIENLQNDKQSEEAEALMEATVHWLRHTGISDDVKRRPREHVRDDAGHSSSAITDKYIDIELKERAKSAKNKPLV